MTLEGSFRTLAIARTSVPRAFSFLVRVFFLFSLPPNDDDGDDDDHEKCTRPSDAECYVRNARVGLALRPAPREC